MLWQNLLDQIRPFNQTDSISIEIIIISDFFHLFNITDPVYIKVIKRHTTRLIFLNDRKGRTVHWLCDSKACSYSLGENRFSYSQVTYQRIYLSRSGILTYPFTKSIGIIGTECFFYHGFIKLLFPCRISLCIL